MSIKKNEKGSNRILSKDEMKKIIAGSGAGTCQKKNEACDSTGNRNCCNGLACTKGVCVE